MILEIKLNTSCDWKIPVEALKSKAIKILNKTYWRKNLIRRPKTMWLSVTLNDINSRSVLKFELAATTL